MENLVESRALLDVPEWLEVELMGKEVELWSLWGKEWSHEAVRRSSKQAGEDTLVSGNLLSGWRAEYKEAVECGEQRLNT